MDDSTQPSSSYTSPKRKRDDDGMLFTYAPSPSRLRTTNLPTRPLLPEARSTEGSPRTSVAGHLQNLDLEEQHQLLKLDFGPPDAPQSGGSNNESSSFRPQICLPSQSFVGPITPPPSSNDPPLGTSRPAFQPQPRTLPLEIPETPRLRPVSSPTPPPSATKPESPSPPSPALWWTDTEITGHNPNDPTDDGYGINGVGFLPTPAIANARSERRKRQVAEWKNREAREARQKRSDRRRRRNMEIASGAYAVDQGENSSMADEGRKVRFLEI